ncbi:MAG: hypothetical protein OEO83_13975 [Alphaproteobacteria bacterium]|nr:hypothetical protein [Alphaproteobacteria bacterium]
MLRTQTSFRRPFFAAAATVAALAWMAAPAAASEHCRDVYVKVTNKTGDKVKIIDLDYFDYGLGKKGRWRSEPTKNEVVPKNQVYQTTRRLENVKAEYTKIRIKYRKPKKFGVGTFGAKVHKSKSTKKQMCADGIKFYIDLK